MIDKISHISTAIATAVEEQSATTGEMARNVSEAARGASTIATQHQRSGGSGAEHHHQRQPDSEPRVEQLARMASQLRELVGRFKVRAENRDGDSAPPTGRRSGPLKNARLYGRSRIGSWSGTHSGNRTELQTRRRFEPCSQYAY